MTRIGAGLGGVFVIAGIAALTALPGAPVAAGAALEAQDTGVSGQPMALDVPVPRLIGETKNWLNTGGKHLEWRKGSVYVVHFWTFG